MKFVLLLLSLHCTALVAQPHTKDFYSIDHIPELHIELKQDNWADQLDSLRLAGDEFLLGDVKIDGQVYPNAGIRYRGTHSFQPGGKRNGFYIKLNYIDQDQNHQGYRVIKSTSALRDPSMVREVIGYEIARRYMPAPRANYVKVFVNDQFYGLLINVEAVNDEFLHKHFGSSDNSFFKCTPQLIDRPAPEGCKNKIFASLEYEEQASCYLHAYEIRSRAGWDDLMELTRILAQEPNRIEEILDVDATLWMLAFNNVLVNLSSYSGQYSQNYYLYRNNFGRFVPVIWDLNLAFGSYKNTGEGSDLDLQGLQQMDPLLHQNNVSKPLIYRLLQNKDYQRRYLSHLRQILYENFVDDNFENRAKSLQQLIATDLLKDTNKFYSPEEFQNSLYVTTGQRSKIPGIMELMNKRVKFLRKHPQLTYVPPEIITVELERRKKFSNDLVDKFSIRAQIAKRAKKVRLFYRFSKEQDYQMVFMEDDGKHNDGKPGDKIFGISIDPEGEEQIQFFLIAENAKSMSFYPENYMFQPLSYSLEQLNQ